MVFSFTNCGPSKVCESFLISYSTSLSFQLLEVSQSNDSLSLEFCLCFLWMQTILTSWTLIIRNISPFWIGLNSDLDHSFGSDQIRRNSRLLWLSKVNLPQIDHDFHNCYFRGWAGTHLRVNSGVYLPYDCWSDSLFSLFYSRDQTQVTTQTLFNWTLQLN